MLLTGSFHEAWSIIGTKKFNTKSLASEMIWQDKNAWYFTKRKTKQVEKME